jgi:hypothetical protein
VVEPEHPFLFQLFHEVVVEVLKVIIKQIKIRLILLKSFLL